MKERLKSPWAVGIGTTLLGFILSVLYDLVKGNKLMETALTILGGVCNCVVAVLSFELKVWWILIAGILIGVVMKYQKQTKDVVLPDFITYRFDNFRNWKWSWDWHFSELTGEWIICDLKAHCPKCDTPMLHDYWEAEFQCPRCQYQSEYSEHERSSEVKAVIIDNIRRNCYNREQK